jgi:hypothetical protein
MGIIAARETLDAARCQKVQGAAAGWENMPDRPPNEQASTAPARRTAAI